MTASCGELKKMYMKRNTYIKQAVALLFVVYNDSFHKKDCPISIIQSSYLLCTAILLSIF